MEPKVLMIGRSQNVIDILIGGLKNMGHDIIGTDNQESVYNLIKNHQIELVFIGAGLPDAVRTEMKEFIISIKPGLPVHLIERTPDSNPKKMIEFVEQKIADFKLSKK